MNDSSTLPPHIVQRQSENTQIKTDEPNAVCCAAHRETTGPTFKSTDEKRADLTAPLLLKFVILRSKSFTFSFCLFFFFHGSVTVAKAVSHSAVWDLQSAAKISSSRRPVAVANENHNP